MEQREVILIKVLGFKQWKPLYKTNRFDDLFLELDDDMEALILHEFTTYLLHMLREKIQNAIKTQRFPVRYPPLSPQYLAKKKKQGRKLGFWISSGYLVKGLKYWYVDSEDAYYIGIPEGIRHPDNKQLLSMILLTLELGSPERNIPPRPLFFPYANSMSKSITHIFERYLRKYRPELVPFVK